MYRNLIIVAEKPNPANQSPSFRRRWSLEVLLTSNSVTNCSTRSRDPKEHVWFNEHLQHAKTVASFSCSLSVICVQNTCNLVTCLRWWCQSVAKTVLNRRRKEFSIHAPTVGNGCRVWHRHRSRSKSSQTCSLARLQTFHFTIRTNSTNSGFALCPRFAALKSVCNSFLFWCQLWFWNCCQNYWVWCLVFAADFHPENSTQNNTQRSKRGTKHILREARNPHSMS